MDKKQAMNKVVAKWFTKDYSYGDCVRMAVDYLTYIGKAPKGKVKWTNREELTVKKVMAVLGRPLPQGEEGDIVLSEQVLALNPGNDVYVFTMMDKPGHEKGGFAMIDIGAMRAVKALHWRMADG